ncbi:MAG: Ig-like domain-containing protein [bacterium]
MNLRKIKLVIVSLLAILTLSSLYIFSIYIKKSDSKAVLGDTIVTSAIALGADDSTLINNVFSAVDSQVKIGKDASNSVSNAFRFGNIAIPKGAVISSAYFSYSGATNENSTGVNVQIAAQATDNGVSPTTQAEFSSKMSTLTTAKVNWSSIITQLYGDLVTSPNINTVINEITSRSGWVSGNSILLFFTDNATTNYSNRKYMSFEYNSINPKPTLTITYSMPNVNPVANADTATTLAGDSVTIDVLANDTDADGNTLSITSAGSPTHGVSVINAGNIVYTPSIGFSGDDTFTYSISDGSGGTSSASVSVHVMSKTGRYLITYTIDRSSVPDLYYKNLSLKIHLGTVTSPTVIVDNQIIDSTYSPSTGDLIFNTSGTNVQINFRKSGTITEIGTLTKNVLMNDKKWAWSHSLDDNTNLWGSINVLNAKNWKGMLYFIANTIDDTRQQNWIIDAPDMKTLLSQGWSIGNHTWDHACSGHDATFYRSDVLEGYNRIKPIINSSSISTYKLMAFAAPCFESGYDSVIQQLVTEGTIDTKFNESGNDYRLIVDSGSTNYTNNSKTAKAFSTSMNIGRDPNLQLGNTGVSDAKAELDWMASNATSNKHFWYNTFAHGNNEAYLSDFVDYLYNSYGPGGTNEVWVAPSDEIYSYILVRNNSTVTYSSIAALANDNPVISNVGLIRAADNMTVNWDTDKNTSSIIEYGLTSSYTNTTTEADISPRVLTHSVNIPNLVACSIYHFRIKAIDSSLNEGVSSDGTFTTSGCLGDSVISSQASSSIDKDVGGTLQQIDQDKGLILTVPISYYTDTLNFQIKKLSKISVIPDTSSPAGYSAIGDSLYDIKALNNVSNIISTFNASINVAMQYGDSDIVDYDSTSLKVYRYDGTWHLLPACNVNLSQRKVSCVTTGFSVFGLFALTPQSSSSVTSTTSTLTSTTSSTISSISSSTSGISGGSNSSNSSGLIINYVVDSKTSSSTNSGNSSTLNSLNNSSTNSISEKKR